MDRSRGFLILVDGPSGSGKDTLIDGLSLELREQGYNVKVLAEEEVDVRRNEIIEAKTNGNYEMASVLIDHRKKIFEQFVEPALRDFDIVILNRGETSTLAYQTIDRDLTVESVFLWHRLVGILLPDLIVILNCSAETAILRIEGQSWIRGERERSGGMGGKVTEGLEHRKRIHCRYDEVARFLGEKTETRLINNENMSVSQEITIILPVISKYVNTRA